MQKLLSVAVIVSLASGCDYLPKPVVLEPEDESRIEPPKANSAKAFSCRADPIVVLNINENGQVLLGPIGSNSDMQPAAADRESESTLDNPDQVQAYMKRRAATERRAANRGCVEIGDSDELRSYIMLRIDRRTPFAKTHAITMACRHAGYEDLFLQVIRVSGCEAYLNYSSEEAGDERTLGNATEQKRGYVVRVKGTDDGRIADITLGGESLGEDVRGLYRKRMTDAMNRKRIEADATNPYRTSPKLTIEIDGKLLHEYVVALIDEACQAGFYYITPVPIDPAKR